MKPFKPREELDDTKSKKSLAELYEAEYLKSTAPDRAPGDPKDEALKKCYDEINDLLKSLFWQIGHIERKSIII